MRPKGFLTPDQWASRGDPQVLWHYTDLTAADAILRPIGSAVPPNDLPYLRASDHRYLNDSAEFSHAAEVGISIASSEAASAVRSRWLAEIGSASATFVTSFSERCDSLSQWRAYGGECPVALGIIRPRLDAMAKNWGCRLEAVVYDEVAQRRVIQPVASEFSRLLAPVLQPPDERDIEAVRAWNESKIQLEVAARAFAEVAPLIKHPSFSDEQELRLLKQFRHPWHDYPKVHVRRRGFMAVPYINLPFATGYHEFPFHVVMVGPNPHSDHVVDALRELVNSRGLRRSVDVVASRVPYRNW